MPTPITLVPRYENDVVSEVKGLKAIFGYTRGTGGRNVTANLITNITTTPLASGEALCELLAERSDMKVKNILAVTHDTDQVTEPAPEIIPDNYVLNFSVRPSWLPAFEASRPMKQIVPAATFDTAEEIDQLGEAIAALMLTDANVDECVFTGPTRSYK